MTDLAPKEDPTAGRRAGLVSLRVQANVEVRFAAVGIRFPAGGKTMKVVLCAFLLTLFSGVGSAATPFDGKWIVHLTGATTDTLHLNFKSSDDQKIGGTLQINEGPELPIEWGMAKGDLLTFHVKQPFQGTSAQTFVYLGRLEGDHIAFARRPFDLSVGRLREFTAERAK
jgi:hypothetical protein